MTPARKPTRGRFKATKPAAKKTARKTAAKKTTATKPTAKKTAPKKPTAKKPTAKKPTAKKTVAKRTTTTKPTAKKPTAAKTAAKKTPARAAATAKKTPEAASKPPAARPFVRPVPPTAPKRRTRPATFDAEQLKKIRASLAGKRTELEKRMAELEEDSFDATQSDITGEVGLDEDFADAGTATFERERDLSIRNNIRDLIDQMTRAMRRIDDRTYGICERCGNPIDAARLRELPHASLCLDCKRREERAR